MGVGALAWPLTEAPQRRRDGPVPCAALAHPATGPWRGMPQPCQALGSVRAHRPSRTRELRGRLELLQQRGNFFWTSMTSCALLSWIFNLSRSRVSAASCLSSARAGSIFGPRFLEAVPVSSPAAYWRRQVASEDEYAPSRRISAPISPGWVHAAAASTMRRLSALVKRRRLATATTSESMPGDNGGADTGASPVALRAPCDAPVSAEFLAACICALA